MFGTFYDGGAKTGVAGVGRALHRLRGGAMQVRMAGSRNLNHRDAGAVKALHSTRPVTLRPAEINSSRFATPSRELVRDDVPPT